MPVTFKVANHDARPIKTATYGYCKDASDVLTSSWGEQSDENRFEELLQSSFSSDFGNLGPQGNGFVDTIIHAYNQHHHLVLRPDDVWIAILGQFNFYVNANAEQLRSHFVAHKGKKKLTVRAGGTRYTVNFGSLANQMTEKIHENVVDKTLKEWILPDFSTTSFNDVVVCAVLMMSTLKQYFSYVMELTCGIPSVTLEGTKKDWKKLLNRLDKLASFGREPEAWGALLRPILRRFVSAFDGKPDIDFWARICHVKNYGSGTPILSGWITAFCVWGSTGKWQGPNIDKVLSASQRHDNTIRGRGTSSLSGWITAFCVWGSTGKWQGTNIDKVLSPSQGHDNTTHGRDSQLVLDGVRYGSIGEDKIPVGFCDVDVELIDNGELFDCMMVSGHVAGRLQGPERDTLRPAPGWFMFIKPTNPA